MKDALCPVSGYEHAHCSRCGAEKTSRYCDECDATGTTFVRANEECDRRGERGQGVGSGS